MSYLMENYKKIYRLMTEYDLTTNDFPRDLKGAYSDNDVYIKCAGKIKIFYYGKGILECYIPSIGRGHNILIAIAKEFLDYDESKYKEEGSSFNYESLYQDLDSQGILNNVIELDGELLFQFNNKNMKLLEPFLKPATSGANISPFSSKNLPKSTYIIPSEDLLTYKDLIGKLSQKDALKVGHITNAFIKKMSTRSKPYEALKTEMKRTCTKGKEFIHYSGKWKEYIKYLDSEINLLLFTNQNNQ